MKDFHLLGEELFQPLVLLDVIVNELDSQSPRDFNGSFSLLTTVEPGFRPPYDAVSVGIDTDRPLDVETLNVYLKVCQWVNDTLTFYSPVSSFFFSTSLMDDRKTLCIRAR